jgi:hypothetical protein
VAETEFDIDKVVIGKEASNKGVIKTKLADDKEVVDKQKLQLMWMKVMCILRREPVHRFNLR